MQKLETWYDTMSHGSARPFEVYSQSTKVMEMLPQAISSYFSALQKFTKLAQVHEIFKRETEVIAARFIVQLDNVRV